MSASPGSSGNEVLSLEGERAGAAGSDLPPSRLGDAIDGAEMVDVVRGVDRTAAAVPCAAAVNMDGGGAGLRARVRVGESGGWSEGDDVLERRRSGLTAVERVRDDRRLDDGDPGPSRGDGSTLDAFDKARARPLLVPRTAPGASSCSSSTSPSPSSSSGPPASSASPSLARPSLILPAPLRPQLFHPSHSP